MRMAPTPSSPAATTPTANALTSLRSVSDILHLSYHRNKNQHRLAKWWSSLSQLKRNVQKLIIELETLETAEIFEVKGKKKKGGDGKYVVAAREKVEVRAEFMEERLVPGCYTAFSNLVADNQYAPLGLVLMGTLARVKRIIRPFGKEIAVPSSPPVPGSSTLNTEHDTSSVGKKEPTHDLGEVISRSHLQLKSGEPVLRKDALDERMSDMDDGLDAAKDEDQDDMERAEVKKAKKKRKTNEDGEASALGTASTLTPLTKKRLKKRKKGGDAFDDLFSGLI